MGLHTDGTCDFCKDSDTIELFFYNCKHIKSFWSKFEDWWNGFSQIANINLNLAGVILGIVQVDSVMNSQLNYCLLLAKQLIYRCRHAGKKVGLIEFLINLKNHLIVEEEISLKNKNHEQFVQIWGEIYFIL